VVQLPTNILSALVSYELTPVVLTVGGAGLCNDVQAYNSYF